MEFNEAKALKLLRTKHQHIDELTTRSEKLKNLSLYEWFRRSLEKCGRNAFGRDVEVHFFGSRFIGTASDASDLDIFVDIGYRFYAQSNAGTTEHNENLQKLLDAMYASGEWKTIAKITKTPVPIIIADSISLEKHETRCDTNVCNGLGASNSRLLAHLLKIQPQAVSLYHFINLWCLAQDVDFLKGYNLTLLLLFYLQSKNLMPTIERVQSGVKKVMIDGWEVQFEFSRNLESYGCSQMKSYRDHIKGFFKFYKDFNFDDLVISPYSGKALNALDYKDKYPKFNMQGLYIAGPVNQGTNCKAMSEAEKRDFITMLKESSAFLDTLGPL